MNEYVQAGIEHVCICRQTAVHVSTVHNISFSQFSALTV